MSDEKLVKVELKHPVAEMTSASEQEPSKPTGKTISAVTLRRVKVKDLRAVRGIEDEAESGFVLAARLAGLNTETFDELDADDLNAITEAVNGLGKDQATGGMSSET